jgi:hypothetical protein
MNGSASSIVLQGRQFQCSIGSDHGIVLVGDAAHTYWQPSSATYLDQSDFPPLQDRIVEQIGNGVSVLCVGWHEQVLNQQQKQAFFEFLSVGAVEYPILYDFKDPSDLRLALEVLPGIPLVKLPSYDDPQLDEFLSVGMQHTVQWLCPIRSFKKIPWNLETKFEIIERWQAILQQKFAIYLPIPTPKPNSNILYTTLAGITTIKEKFNHPVLIRPSGSQTTVSKGWLQAALTVWAIERGVDGLLLNPLQREVANISNEIAGLVQRPIQKLPLEMKRWIK